ncbi:peptidoglycan editing factor PgeF [Dechloromonas sp. TW-R-39-2]|uniref:peptidoglycan editing factor PgeF n=1 Tax=Dechloromonas sp. TW-R-39-2 TaxID=2654218 RepID=UPI00193D757B|nr:peptidoglycan editing factor PgeF [Dechloromonas sp. TW-R-39-2]QRM19608.1 peptidoglycan editing factor PgeF [Dechloromonas sp. TW-R-39-2]
MADFLIPDWPAPVNVRALQTTRLGGVSETPWLTLNLGDHVGDAPAHVAANRVILRNCLPAEPLWLRQVHGITAVDADFGANLPEADAAYARLPGHVCAVMTADCLPVLFCDKAGTVVAAAHAGWRGLLGGVLENTLAKMAVPPAEILTWFGPAIGPDCFEVGDEVRAAFVLHDAEAAQAFKVSSPGKWLADIYLLARLRLHAAGVLSISGGNLCTVSDAQQFFSYRRDGVTGRMASLIWLAPSGSGV